MKYIPRELRALVKERAQNCCEYCLISQVDLLFPFEIDHVISEKHAGPTHEDNLALSCPHCNRYKGTDIASNDPETGEITRLFNPRQQLWNEHFYFESSAIMGQTPEGRTTVFILQLNEIEHLTHRAGLMEFGLYPRAKPT